MTLKEKLQEYMDKGEELIDKVLERIERSQKNEKIRIFTTLMVPGLIFLMSGHFLYGMIKKLPQEKKDIIVSLQQEYKQEISEKQRVLEELLKEIEDDSNNGRLELYEIKNIEEQLLSISYKQNPKNYKNQYRILFNLSDKDTNDKVNKIYEFIMDRYNGLTQVLERLINRMEIKDSLIKQFPTNENKEVGLDLKKTLLEKSIKNTVENMKQFITYHEKQRIALETIKQEVELYYKNLYEKSKNFVTSLLMKAGYLILTAFSMLFIKIEYTPYEREYLEEIGYF